MTAPNSTTYNNAITAASIIGNALGIAPSTIYGQFVAENGAGLTGPGAQNNNFANLSPGGQIASYSSPQAFANAYISTIANNFPNAINSGSNVNNFVAALENGTNGVQYQTGSWGTYANNIANGAAGYSNQNGQSTSNGQNSQTTNAAPTVWGTITGTNGQTFTEYLKSQAKNGGFIIVALILLVFALMTTYNKVSQE